MKKAAVLVLGDIGTSPRMCNHAYELATTMNYKVDLIGYHMKDPYPKIMGCQNIRIVGMSFRYIEKLRRLPVLLYILIRVFIQILQLLYIFLFKIKWPHIIIVQNPPTIPVLSTLWIISTIQRSKVIIDIHNYGYTKFFNIKNKKLIAIAKAYEIFFAKLCGHRFLCVSEAMSKDVKNKWKGINAHVVYDKANTDLYSPIDIEQKHDFLKSKAFVPSSTSDVGNEETILTQKKPNGRVEWRKNRSILLITCTSWTEDEDIGCLKRSLEAYEQNAVNGVGGKYYPKIQLVITGAGPMKKQFMEEVSKKEKDWKFISIKSMWLTYEEYPKMIAASDVGVCLHYSSSGYDLPMKVLDMFGSGIPVLAIDYNCISESVQHNKNGLIFKDQEELTKCIHTLFVDWPKNEKMLESMQNEVKKQAKHSWHMEWQMKVQPIIEELLAPKSGSKKCK